MSEPKRFGATPKVWAHFKRLAKRDLLPVVSNPNLPLSPHSKMKGVGKTPSVLNHKREVIGFKEWTDHEATVRNIEAWAEEPDFGICIQTRRVRGFDIDVEDANLARKIRRGFLQELGRDSLPRRWRADSGNELLAFIVEGDLEKRSFAVKEWREWDREKGREVTKRWIVEFLADGQQFVAVGTHPKGESYQWDDGLPSEFPVISAADFERAWDAVVAEFAREGRDRRSSRRDPTLPEDLDVDDPVAEHLIETWDTYGIHKGMLYIDCPWKENHSSDNGETETAWMLAGTGKYRNGHFACRHAGCAEHTDADFLQAVAYRPAKAESFEDLTKDDLALAAYEKLAPGASAKSKELKAERKAMGSPLPGFDRDDKGRIETNLKNIRAALLAPQACGAVLVYDEFRGDLLVGWDGGSLQPFDDSDAVELRIRLEDLGFKEKIGRELMRDALTKIARERRFDSANEWLRSLPDWDGVERIERFWPDYMQTDDTPYTRALGLYTWTAQAARVLDPGCKVDMIPVLVGPEGVRKSTAVRLLSPSSEYFGEFSFHEDDKELARKMRGKLVGELAELRGITARDGQAILAWITRQEEEWNPKFKEANTKLKRRLLFYGTTNEQDFLQAHMGLRRWLPVMINSPIATGAIQRDLHQLWAEARDRYWAEGIELEVEQLAKAERASYEYTDPWHDQIAKWLDEDVHGDGHLTPRASGKLRTEDVLVECCGMERSKIRKADQMRIAAVLSALEMVRVQKWVGGRNQKVWVDARRGS
ncbi:VapE domain-containing protein [Phenylobacterium sp.]|uniref:VapE domain-containing protein n=1 Tax=Phenylobacterium sp. TaxID=1871053 RepID=UPI0025EDC927|nr:VapE domain-containing protein [Phenylobacterium sp.]